MFNIFTLIQEIFFGKECNATKIGLTCFKCEETTEKPQPQKISKEVKLSELMKKSSC